MPTIEQVPWAYGGGAYYRGQNRPVAVVLHRMQGYASTARQWALSGYTGASWHYTVGLDGSIMQHLSHEDGGYHAGIPSSAPAPTWSLWRGHGQNVNKYTIGIECEGFEGKDWPEAQLESLLWLCRKLADELGIPYDREHFPPHADIDVINRRHDFDTPVRRETIVYPYLFQEDEMADPRLAAVVAALGGMAEIEAWNARGNSLLLGYAIEQQRTGELEGILSAHIASPHVGGGITPEQFARAIELGAKATADSIKFAGQVNGG